MLTSSSVEVRLSNIIFEAVNGGLRKEGERIQYPLSKLFNLYLAPIKYFEKN